MNRITAFVTVFALLFGICACAEINVAALNGPTGMGMVKMMEDENGKGEYSFELAASADLVTPGLIKGDIDIACVPANLAGVLYNRTSGGIKVLAVNTLGVMYIVESGNAVQCMQDLKGKVIYSAGKGSVPEFTLRYLLSENGVDPDRDVTIDWKSEHAECLTAIMQDENAVAMLPQPFVTVAQNRSEKIRVALSLTDEWNRLENGSAMITGVVIARKEFVESSPEAVVSFMQEYSESVDWVNANTADAAALIGKYNIVAENVAVKALPYCNIVCITGSEMKSMLNGYLEVLYEQNPASVGGQMPQEDFWYAAE